MEDSLDVSPPPPARRPAPPLTVYGLEVGLLDVGRFVALNGYAEECKRLPFVSPDFAREEDFVVALKNVTYGPYERTRFHALERKGDGPKVRLLLKVGADVDAWTTEGETPLHFASEEGRTVRERPRSATITLS
jgi:hypothetical protein